MDNINRIDSSQQGESFDKVLDSLEEIQANISDIAASFDLIAPNPETPLDEKMRKVIFFLVDNLEAEHKKIDKIWHDLANLKEKSQSKGEVA